MLRLRFELKFRLLRVPTILTYSCIELSCFIGRHGKQEIAINFKRSTARGKSLKYFVIFISLAFQILHVQCLPCLRNASLINVYDMMRLQTL